MEHADQLVLLMYVPDVNPVGYRFMGHMFVVALSYFYSHLLAPISGGVCGKSSQVFVIYFVSLLSKPIFRATIHCRKRNSAEGRVNRDIAPQGAEFYDKSFMFG
jgi:hypothetical protein